MTDRAELEQSQPVIGYIIKCSSGADSGLPRFRARCVCIAAAATDLCLDGGSTPSRNDDFRGFIDDALER
jgi:hypothetical protein